MTNPGEMKITVSENGPYIVEGTMPVAEQHIEIDKAGQSIEWREGKSFEHPREIQTVPVRSLAEQAVLRRHAQEGRVRRNRNGEPRIVRRHRGDCRGAHAFTDGRRVTLRVRAVLRSGRTGVESREADGRRRAANSISARGGALSRWTARRGRERERLGYGAEARGVDRAGDRYAREGEWAALDSRRHSDRRGRRTSSTRCGIAWRSVAADGRATNRIATDRTPRSAPY